MRTTTHIRPVLALMLLLGAGIVPSCAKDVPQGTDSSTHWMATCSTDADCGGLPCECGVCTKTCVTETDCKGLPASASCTTRSGCSASLCTSSAVISGGPPDGSLESGAAVVGSKGGPCPSNIAGNAPCDGRIEQCWTACTQGFRGQYVCSDGTWLAGHGLFPCGADAGSSSNPGNPMDAGHPNDAGPVPVSLSCTRSADCYAADTSCCPRCDTQPTIATKVGIARSSISTYNEQRCATAGACPPCVPPPGTIDSFCKAGVCDVEDLGKYKACAKDADCKLVAKDCCACGALPNTALAALSDEPGFLGDHCATVDCAACPSGVRADDASRPTCNTTYGYCEIAPPR